ncbi:ATP-binding protein [Streptomyces sp. CRN 30]|uniref:ATP-binding protein n=1 Tax=Streptomyces sp. CRN 30 TaxID=3075613 RepID=UPI002A81D0A0|nr:ATP-binding protein [Streptomyces sp. CRN 30]
MPTTTTTTHFTQRYAATPEGAHLARRRAVRWMGERGYSPMTDASCAVALVVGELTANAVSHGRVPGRDFGVSLTLDTTTCLLRVEVADAATEKPLPLTAPPPTPDEESGRGLLLVDVLSIRWGVTPGDPVGKTVWAELDVTPSVPSLIE